MSLIFPSEPKKICEFKSVKGKVLKTVDSVFPDLKTFDECQNKCLRAEYRCFSFDLGDPSRKVCRTSHLDSASLSHIEDAYFDLPEAITYELDSCYEGEFLAGSLMFQRKCFKQIDSYLHNYLLTLV